MRAFVGLRYESMVSSFKPDFTSCNSVTNNVFAEMPFVANLYYGAKHDYYISSRVEAVFFTLASVRDFTHEEVGNYLTGNY